MQKKMFFAITKDSLKCYGGKYNEKKLTEEEIKLDCGRKAFVRLAEKIKRRILETYGVYSR